ncbi:metallophosphoesterase, partial [bacterium]|nr:metallophosphoesterase [bacterium]
MKKTILILTLLAIAVAQGAQPWRLQVIFNNDRHGSLGSADATFMNPETPPPLGKFPSEAAIVEDLRKTTAEKGEGFLYLDQGDIYQGAPVGSLTKGMAVVTAYNILMPDAVTVGNHELDDGVDNLKSLIAASNFDWITANLIDRSTGKLVEGLKPFIIKEFDLPGGKRLKVGIIGITTKDTKTMSFPEHTAGIEVLDEAETANAYAETLRTKYDVDFVIASCHMGLPFDLSSAYSQMGEIATQYESKHYGGINMVEMASKLHGVDVAFGGHIHIGYRKPWEDPHTHVLVFQNYAHGTGFGGVAFLFDPESKVFLGYEPIAKDNDLVTLFSDEFWPDKGMEATVESLQIDSNKGLAEIIGEASAFLPRGDAASN